MTTMRSGAATVIMGSTPRQADALGIPFFLIPLSVETVLQRCSDTRLTGESTQPQARLFDPPCTLGHHFGHFK